MVCPCKAKQNIVFLTSDCCLHGIQEELVAMGIMRPSADAALAARSAMRAAKSARRLKEAQQKREFRRFTTPNGLQVCLYVLRE